MPSAHEEPGSGHESQDRRWQISHAKIRSEKGLLEEDRWSRDHDLSAYSARVRDSVDLFWQLQAAEARASGHWPPSRRLILDTSQSSARSPLATTFRSIVCNSTFYSYARARMVAPEEHYRILGWPDSRIPSCQTPHQMRDCAGDSMAMPSATGVATAVMCHLRGGVWERNA